MQGPLPRRLAIGILLALGCTFAANHIAARVAFDHGTSLLVAVLCRSTMAATVLTALVLWQRQAVQLPARTWRWVAAVGLLTAAQSAFIYMAISRVPVALALLVANVFPLLLALWTWAFGGPRPTRRASVLMGVILAGLSLALDLPGRIGTAHADTAHWTSGILLALGGATSFSLGVWIADHKLVAVRSSVRSMMTMQIALVVLALAGTAGVVPGGIVWPHDAAGWTGLVMLATFYGAGFSVLFVLMPRLDLARNAPAMNIEPVATLLFGWLVLQQTLAPVQIAGALVVVTGIVLLSYKRAA